MRFREHAYLAELNKELKLHGTPFALQLDENPDEREIFDRWAKAAGYEGGVEFFEKNSIDIKGPVSEAKYYGYAGDPPFGGAVHRLYGESLLRYRNEMQARGMDEIYWQDYTPLPTWRTPTMNNSPAEYDLNLISFKKIEFKQGRASQIALLSELAPHQVLEIHPETAGKYSIADGDEVVVESHNAVTDERRSLKAIAVYRQSIRPDVVGMPHHYGEVANHPWAKGEGPSPNQLFFTGEGYVANTADQSFHVRVKVRKA